MSFISSIMRLFHNPPCVSCRKRAERVSRFSIPSGVTPSGSVSGTAAPVMTPDEQDRIMGRNGYGPIKPLVIKTLSRETLLDMAKRRMNARSACTCGRAHADRAKRQIYTPSIGQLRYRLINIEQVALDADDRDAIDTLLSCGADYTFITAALRAFLNQDEAKRALSIEVGLGEK